MDLRPLNKDKILDPSNPSFKFKAGNSLERILDSIQASRNSSFQATEQLAIPSRSMLSRFNSRSRLVSQTLSPKHLYPTMHQKTHFKAVQEIFINPASGKTSVTDEQLRKAIRIAP